MIHYAIQHFGTEHRHLMWLVDALKESSPRVEVALDAEAGQVEGLAAALAPKGVEVVQSAPVTWGGPSIVMQMRDAMLRAVAAPGWTWFINLSGACVPIVEPARMQEHLERTVAATGTSSFCYGFPVRRPAVWLPFAGVDAGKPARLARVTVRLDTALTRLREKGEFDPVRMIEQRRAVHCTETLIDNQKGLQLRGLLPSELQDRQRFWTKRPWLIGRQWVVLHRDVVEWLCESPEVAKIAIQLSQTFIPDETFFQSSLSVAPPSLQKTICMHSNLRFRNGAAVQLDESLLREARHKGVLFARKLDADANDLRDFIGETLWSSPRPDTAPTAKAPPAMATRPGAPPSPRMASDSSD